MTSQEHTDDPTVLFVDDEERVLRALQRMLVDEPFAVLVSDSGDRALQLLAQEKVDVVVSDEQMPGMSGSEFLAEVRHHFPDIIRIMLTGQTDLGAAIQAINEGRIYRFLLKPVSPDDLVEVIQEALQERTQSEQLLSFSQQAGDVCSLEVTCQVGTVARLRWSANARVLFDLPRESTLDSMDILYSRLHPDDEETIRALSESCLQNHACPSVEYRLLMHDGRVRWISQTSDVSMSADGKTQRVLSVLKDISESKQQRERLNHQAYHDVLTGLGNRALLMDRLSEALRLAEVGQRRVALLFLDLDDFKVVNDSMGHSFGDWLLQAFAQRLRALEPERAMTARLGGDEFAMLVYVDDARQALETARTIQNALAEPFSQGDYALHVSVSIGIALGEDGSTPSLDLLRDADTAMYAAKSTRKGSCRLFDTSMHDKASERFLLTGDMHRALAGDEFFLAFQPIVRLENLIVAGYEALIRWQHPRRGLIMPDVFIPLAEENGLITRIGLQVIDMACHQASKWLHERKGAPPFMSLNVAVQQLRQAQLVPTLKATIKKYGLDPGRIKVEITESGIMEDVELSLRMIGDLKEIGIKLQIDDFGTGYSSLSYLQRIPADNLKVDKSFVIGMENDPEKVAIVKTIVDLATSLGLSIVAEGVETHEQLALLRSLGCEYGQGYLFDRPLPPEEAVTRTKYSACFKETARS